MSYHHPSYNPGNGQYTAGDVSASFNYIVNSSTPSYAVMFYSPTEHEQISEVKYTGKVGYDKGMNQFIESLKGAPLEAYLPVLHGSMDNGSASPTVREIRTEITLPDKVRKEIEEAMKKQLQDIKKDKTELSPGEIVFRDKLIEEIRLRRVMQREIRVKKK